MASQGDGGADGAKKPEQADFTQLTRRRIYYNRLIGDIGDSQKVKATRSAPWWVVLRFLCYAMIANMVIIFRINVTVFYEVNRGIREALEETFFEDTPRRKYFRDIQNVPDVMDWFTNVMIRQASWKEPFSSPLSLTSFNRIIPERSACTSHASITMTARFAKMRDDYTHTTTERFRELYPEVWTRSEVPAGSYPDELGEIMGVLNKSFPFRGSDHYKDIPEDLLGFDPHVLSIGAPIETLWAYTPAGQGAIESYEDQGGYVALLTLGTGSDGTFQNHVVLLDPQNTTQQNLNMTAGAQSEFGMCQNVQASRVLPWEDFKNSLFLSGTLASLAITFASYNANFQALSSAQILFNFQGTGVLLHKKVTIKTTMMDLFNETSWMGFILQWLQLAYLICTIMYFLELAIRSYRNYKKAIWDVWSYVNLASIVWSMTSIILVYTYRRTNETFVSSGVDFRTIRMLNNDFYDFNTYVQFSSLAVFTIWLRLLQFLGNSKPRVMLLLRTLGMSAGNMAIYITFIMVVFWGFMAFAWTTFSPVSVHFSSLMQATLTCFEMFLGKVDKMNDIPQSFIKDVFFILFMSTFFFISVQMFNAIINYSYNRVSEEMEAQFEHERNERKRKDMQRKLEHKDSAWKAGLKVIARLCRCGKREESDKNGAVETHEAVAQKGDAPVFEAIQDETVKEKVEAFMEREKQRKVPDGMCSKIAFLIFAAAYISFLQANITVTDNAKLQAAMRGRVETVYAREPLTGMNIHLRDVNNIESMSQWVTHALPNLFFTEDVTSQSFGDANPNRMCLNHWNCIVSLPEAGGRYNKFLRLTQRRTRENNNTEDLLNGSTKTLTPVVYREGATVLRAHMSYVEGVENNTQGALIPGFCTERGPAEGGYLNLGGLVCLLDANKAACETQLDELRTTGFYSMSTGSLTVDFVAYNGNKNMLVYVEIIFTVMPSGVVETNIGVRSLVLLDLDDFKGNIQVISYRLLPGLIYVSLVFYFAYVLLRDLASECYRKRVNDNMGKVAATIEFFTLDIFNFLEVVSILVSLISFGMFLVFLTKEYQLGAFLGTTYAELINYSSELMSSMLLYNRLSALNMLMLFVRPLKFTRENPRMAKLNQTLFDARTDITWFVVMLFITMIAFVMLAHLSFGSQIKELSTFSSATIYCFYYILGTFEFEPLQNSDGLMAVLFFFPYLILFYCVFTNIFFAIIDRNFVTAEPPPLNLKRLLKPAFSRVCRCIEWDEDYVMEDDPNKKKKEGPPSRKGRVKDTAMKIEEILRSAGDTVLSAGVKTSKMLNEICDVDERMSDVVHWSREEAKKFVDNFARLLAKKQDPKKAKNEEQFITREVMAQLEEEIEEERKSMEEAMRQQRYNIQVHEQMALRDQDILAQYVMLLEGKIKRKMIEKKALLQEVHHLRGESDNMRFTKEELKRSENADLPAVAVADDAPGAEEGAYEDDGAASSDESGASERSYGGGGQARPKASSDPTAGSSETGHVPKGSAALNSELMLHVEM